MSIKGNNSTAIILATPADFSILNNTTTTRWAVIQLHLHDFSGSGDTIAFFRSPNSTSVSGAQIDNVVLASGASEQSLAATFVLEAGEFLVGNALSGARVNVWAIYTTYTGSS